MFNALRLEGDSKPESIENLNNSTYYYNYDIQSTTRTDENGDTKTYYNFIQIHVKGIPTYKKCVEAIIREYLTVNEEFDLINSMNKITLGLSTSTDDETKYKEYLTLIDTIKTNIKKDFN